MPSKGQSLNQPEQQLELYLERACAKEAQAFINTGVLSARGSPPDPRVRDEKIREMMDLVIYHALVDVSQQYLAGTYHFGEGSPDGGAPRKRILGQ
jgi:hypothetical protein